MKTPSFPKLWQLRLLLLLLLPVSVSAQGSDYDAILHEATQRYRGDIPTYRQSRPPIVYRVDEAHLVKPSADEPFAPQPFTLRITLPESSAPL